MIVTAMCVLFLIKLIWLKKKNFKDCLVKIGKALFLPRFILIILIIIIIQIIVTIEYSICFCLSAIGSQNIISRYLFRCAKLVS